eukprot:TRINITY_DN4275_c0_g1_i1.p1 TRINITY_DN4275_c0_g1~~TRINITY_DN4275_c0_g1_i1.p1  ORF type:complete len:247 (+),score=18.79 TRINITY_DN4275_c0_g1_i1:134-874(+)
MSSYEFDTLTVLLFSVGAVSCLVSAVSSFVLRPSLLPGFAQENREWTFPRKENKDDRRRRWGRVLRYPPKEKRPLPPLQLPSSFYQSKSLNDIVLAIQEVELLSPWVLPGGKVGEGDGNVTLLNSIYRRFTLSKSPPLEHEELKARILDILLHAGPKMQLEAISEEHSFEDAPSDDEQYSPEYEENDLEPVLMIGKTEVTRLDLWRAISALDRSKDELLQDQMNSSVKFSSTVSVDHMESEMLLVC